MYILICHPEFQFLKTLCHVTLTTGQKKRDTTLIFEELNISGKVWNVHGKESLTLFIPYIKWL